MEPEEAREALELVREATSRTRRAVAQSGIGSLFIIWGVVWFLGYLGSQWLREAAGYLWLVLDTLGGVATAIVATRASKRFRTPFGWRVAFLWLALMAYGGILLWIAWPIPGARFLVFITVFVCFGYVVIGLWFSSQVLVAGLALTALAIAGWLVVPAYIGYWMAVLGGGGLIGLGIYITRAWK